MIRREVLWHGDKFYVTVTGFRILRQVLGHGDRLCGTETSFVARRQVFLLVLWFSTTTIIPRRLHTHSFNYHGRHTI